MPHKDNPEETWNYLEVGVERIMTQLQDGMDMKTYMGLYTAIHNFCTAQKPVGGSGSFTNNHNRGGGTFKADSRVGHCVLGQGVGSNPSYSNPHAQYHTVYITLLL